MKTIIVGGVADHVHLLLKLPATIMVAKAMQLIKSGSSLWIHQTFPTQRSFAWQQGYGAFSIGNSQVDSTVAYIRNQDEHHRTVTFQEEYRAFLRRHGFEIDERYVWG